MINSIHVGEQAFLFSFFLSFFGLKRRRILRGCSPMQGHCEFVQRVNSAEEKRVPFPFPLLHNTSRGAKCCVRSCSQCRPAETLLQPHRGVVSGAGCWDSTMCAPQWSVHRLKICCCIFCAEEFLSGIAESRLVSTSFECYLGISAPSLLLESLSEKHSQECLVFLRRLSPR